MTVFKILPVLLLVMALGCKKNDNANNATGNPRVTSTNPTNNLTGVARNQEIEFTFS